MSNPTDSGPWWREPWPWILMAGPFLAIVGCIITMTLAKVDIHLFDLPKSGQTNPCHTRRS